MPAVIIYTSTQACAPVLDLALALRFNSHQLRQLGQLPKPKPARLASLRLDLAHLYQIERTTRWVLGQYAEGLRLPSPVHERGLKDDLALTLWEIEQVTAKLQAVEGGVSHE
jgi:hypothetical protein